MKLDAETKAYVVQPVFQFILNRIRTNSELRFLGAEFESDGGMVVVFRRTPSGPSLQVYIEAMDETHFRMLFGMDVVSGNRCEIESVIEKILPLRLSTISA